MAVMDAAAMDMALRPKGDHAAARLLLNQGINCLLAVSYPMRRIEPKGAEPGIDESEFRKGVDRVLSAGFPAERSRKKPGRSLRRCDLNTPHERTSLLIG